MRALVPFYNARQVPSLFKDMDELFNNWAAAPTRSWDYGTQFVEAEDHFSLSVDIPGIKKNELKLELHGQNLTISGESQREKISRSFRRAFTLPKEVNIEKIEAKFEDGVLELRLPKMEAAKSRTIEIQ